MKILLWPNDIALLRMVAVDDLIWVYCDQEPCYMHQKLAAGTSTRGILLGKFGKPEMPAGSYGIPLEVIDNARQYKDAILEIDDTAVSLLSLEISGVVLNRYPNAPVKTEMSPLSLPSMTQYPNVPASSLFQVLDKGTCQIMGEILRSVDRDISLLVSTDRFDSTICLEIEKRLVARLPADQKALFKSTLPSDR